MSSEIHVSVLVVIDISCMTTSASGEFRNAVSVEVIFRSCNPDRIYS